MRGSASLTRQKMKALIRFLAPLSILPFGAAAASANPLDMLIAGHARAEDLILITDHAREYERAPGLKMENWAESKSAAQNVKVLRRAFFRRFDRAFRRGRFCRGENEMPCRSPYEPERPARGGMCPGPWPSRMDA